jgi:hypothetical protein
MQWTLRRGIGQRDRPFYLPAAVRIAIAPVHDTLCAGSAASACGAFDLPREISLDFFFLN